MRFPLVIFDFDGTLADSLPCFLRFMNRIASEQGFRTIRDDELETLRDLSTRQFLKHLGIPFWRLPGIVRQMRTMMSEEAASISLFPGIDPLLHRLSHAGCQLALVSSNSRANIERVLGSELWKLFRWRQCEASMFGKKSKLRKVLRQSQIPAEHAVYIGDELRDLEAAQATGIAFGGVCWGHTRREQFAAHQPGYLFETVGQMGELLTADT